MKTYDINEAADFLKIDRSTALEFAHLGALPGAKVGRAWVFMEDELVAYLRDMTRTKPYVNKASRLGIRTGGRMKEAGNDLGHLLQPVHHTLDHCL